MIVFLVPTNLFTTCDMINTNAGGGGRGGGTNISVEFQASMRPRFTRGLLTFNFLLNTLRYHYLFRPKTIVFSSFEQFLLSIHQWLFSKHCVTLPLQGH